MSAAIGACIATISAAARAVAMTCSMSSTAWAVGMSVVACAVLDPVVVAELAPGELVERVHRTKADAVPKSMISPTWPAIGRLCGQPSVTHVVPELSR